MSLPRSTNLAHRRPTWITRTGLLALVIAVLAPAFAGVAVAVPEAVPPAAAGAYAAPPASATAASAPRFRRLTVSAKQRVLPAGTSTRLRAVARLAGGGKLRVTKQVRWVVRRSDRARASVKGHTLTTKAPGKVRVRAVLGGRRSKPVRIVVTPAVPVRLSVTPVTAQVVVGATQRFTALARMTNGTDTDLSASASWASSNTAAASVDRGLATGRAPGVTTLTATVGGLSSAATFTVTGGGGSTPPTTPTPPIPGTPTRKPLSLAVTPATVSVGQGATTQLTATLTYDDQTTEDVTATGTWTSSSTAVATVTAGTVTGVAGGTATITATAQGLSAAATVTVVPTIDRMEVALTDGDADIVSSDELVAEARATLGERAKPTDLLPAGPMTWNPTTTSFRVNSLPLGYQDTLLVGNRNYTGSGADRRLATIGTARGSSTPLSFFAAPPFALATGAPQTDPGMNELSRNVVSRLTGADAAPKVTLANMNNSWETGTRQWFARELPGAAVTAANSTCDITTTQPASCLDGTDLLIVGSDIGKTALGADTAARNAETARRVRAAYDQGIPVLLVGDSFDPSSAMVAIADALGLGVSTQFFQVSGLDGATAADQLSRGADSLGAGAQHILDTLTTTPLTVADYNPCIVPSASLDFTGTWATCLANQPTAGIYPYLKALDTLRADLGADNAPSPFAGTRNDDVDLLRILLLLADKDRTGTTPGARPDEDAVAVSYPVNFDQPAEVTRAAFVDHVLSTSWAGNGAAKDTGTLYCVRADLDAGTCKPLTVPEVGPHQRTVQSTGADEWRATGLSLVPGQAAQVTLMQDPGMPVYVRTFYGRGNTSRSFELNGTVATNRTRSRNDRPQYVATAWVRLTPGQATTVSSPYGGPLYVRMASTPALQGTNVPLDVTGAGTHPAILDGNSAQQITDFADDVENNVGGYYADLSYGVLEVHTPLDYLRQGLQPYNETGRTVDYGGPSGTEPRAPGAEPGGGITRFLQDLRSSYVYKLYGLAGLKIPGLALTDTLPTAVQQVCQDQGIPCTDEARNIRTELQHVNYDLIAQCGALCSGNPIDSSGFPRPIGFGEHHELGHNLQYGILRVAWPDTAAGTNPQAADLWSNYTDRSQEVSNNIFPAYGLSQYFRGIDDNALLSRNVGGVAAFSVAQSLRSGLTRNGRLAALEPVVRNGALTCTVLKDFPVGTNPDIAISDAIWSNGAYDIQGPERLNFYLQVALLAQGMQLADGTTLASGWDLYTVLYGAARQFQRISANQAAWDADKAAMGFGSLPWTGAAGSAYPGASVSGMKGNDFLFVQLARITGYDWTKVFASYGVQVTSQARALLLGGLKPLGDVRRAVDRQLPYLSLADARMPRVDIAGAGATWPGFDNNADGDATDAADLAGFTPSQCPS